MSSCINPQKDESVCTVSGMAASSSQGDSGENSQGVTAQLPLSDYMRYGRQMILEGFGLQGMCSFIILYQAISDIIWYRSIKASSLKRGRDRRRGVGMPFSTVPCSRRGR